MATVQLQKTLNAKTGTQHVIDQKQSLEVVKTMLHGGLSSLSYLRNFFAEKAFDRHFYDASKKIYPYEDYASGRLPKSESTASKPRTLMQVLKRNRSKRVDVFLDWLEKGAFLALKDGTLKALQIYVHTDPEDRQKVIETYTFTIKYLPGAGLEQGLAGLELDSSGNPQGTVGTTNAALQQLLRQIMRLCTTLPELPARRFISMELFYNHAIANCAQLKGWTPSTINGLTFAQSEGWETRDDRLKELQSGYHCTSLTISSLRKIDQNLGNSFTMLHPPRFPSILQYDVLRPKLDNIESQQKSSAISEKGDHDTESAPATTPSTVVENEAEDRAVADTSESTVLGHALNTAAPTSGPAHPFNKQQRLTTSRSARQLSQSTQVTRLCASQLDTSFDTQSSHVPEMSKALKAMMQPENLTQGDTQSQAPMCPAIERGEITEITESPGNSNVSLSKSKGPNSVISSSKAVLSQAVVRRLKSSKSVLRSTAQQLAKVNGQKQSSTDLILCQCGYNKDEGDMVCCVYCETWQHLHCYGYTGDNDPRLPSDHVCYQCLLGSNELQVLKGVGDLALKRRGMHFAIESGLKTQKDFAADMGLHMWIGGPLYQHLVNQRYVVRAKGSHKSGFAASGKPHFVAVKEGANHEKMLKNLFDPMAHISHHYELPAKAVTQPSVLTQRLLAAQARNMPPPATPASQMKKQATQTPGSGLDLRASLTPFETPSRSRSRLIHPPKRLRDELDDDDTRAKRRNTPSSGIKRLRSVQTEFLLDAGGMASSPAGPVTTRL